MMQYFWLLLCVYMRGEGRGGEGGGWDFYFLCNWAKKTVVLIFC